MFLSERWRSTLGASTVWLSPLKENCTPGERLKMGNWVMETEGQPHTVVTTVVFSHGHLWLISCSDFAYFHYSTVFHLHSEDKCLQKSILLDVVS